MTRQELEAKMTVLLGGRAAEALAFGEFSTGAADDLVKATDIARSMVARFGMDPGLGQVSYESDPVGFVAVPGIGYQSPRRYSEQTAQAIDEALRTLVNAAFQQARQRLEARRDLLEAGVRLLLERETLLEADLTALTAGTAATA